MNILTDTIKDDVEYLNSTVMCKIGISSIHGVGVIAIRDIPEGTLFTDYNIYHHKIEKRLFTIHKGNLQNLKDEVKKLIFDQTTFPKDTEVFEIYSPNHQVCIQAFLNHSSAPNTDGWTTIKDIKAGEELTECYEFLYENGLSEENINNFNSKEI